MDNLQQVNQSQPEQVLIGAVQHNLTDIMPTASEIGHLWSSYMAESMSVCFLKYFVAKSKDPDIRTVLQRALDVSSQRVKTIEDIFNSINHPIPKAYGEKDVTIDAKQLFSESFTLLYTRLMHKFVLLNYCNAVTVSTRSDFRNYFTECIGTSQEIHKKATEVLLAKGLMFKCPSILTPDRVDYIQDNNYFGTIFGKKRPLNALEIGGVCSVIDTKQQLSTLTLGCSQVVKSKKIKNYLSKYKQIEDKQLKILGSYLADENLPQPAMSEILVTDSKEPPVSDKLILSHITAVASFIIAGYGLALISSARIDLVLTFRGFINEILGLAKDGAELMIENGWLERVPETANRQELIH